jgi:DNA modification methylase
VGVMITILQGDALEKLRELPNESVQCCVTSPPYWGLRDYGTAQWEGGDNDCTHKPTDEWLNRNFTGETAVICGKDSQRASGVSRWYQEDGSCKCGAKRIDAQIGLEDTPDAYVAKLVEVFREVRRVLKNDGTLWLNLGDSYWNGGAQKRDGGHDFVDGGKPKLLAAKGSILQPKLAPIDGWKPKDLCGIPWRVAFALQADGWYLRSDIIWHKPNPMPESVTDRPTKAHEYLFLLSKQERYFYDVESIREKAIEGEDLGLLRGRSFVDGNNVAWHAPSIQARQNNGVDSRTAGNGFRNKRSVWTVPTSPYAEAHFATYPPDLIKPCILAGSRAGDTILDPFGGSGTTGMVAIELGRKAMLIELNPEYIKLIEQRCTTTPGFAL